MSAQTDARRAKLREKLIDIAEDRIATGGVHALKARDLAKEAGCALGAIYTHFADMQALSMEVNGRTFRKLGAAVTTAVTSSEAEDPVERLVVMGHAYLHFAAENTAAWRALFDLEMSTDQDVPDWYLAELGKLFAIIAGPLAQLRAELEPEALDVSVRTLFSAVHGIVLLGLEKRISGVPVPRMEAMIRELITEYLT